MVLLRGIFHHFRADGAGAADIYTFPSGARPGFKSAPFAEPPYAPTLGIFLSISSTPDMLKVAKGLLVAIFPMKQAATTLLQRERRSSREMAAAGGAEVYWNLRKPQFPPKTRKLVRLTFIFLRKP